MTPEFLAAAVRAQKALSNMLAARSHEWRTIQPWEEECAAAEAQLRAAIEKETKG